MTSYPPPGEQQPPAGSYPPPDGSQQPYQQQPGSYAPPASGPDLTKPPAEQAPTGYAQPGGYQQPGYQQPGFQQPGGFGQPGAPVPPANPYAPGPAGAPGVPAPVAVKAGQIGWLAPFGALLAVIGLFTPWFKPSIKVTPPNGGGTVTLPFDNLYSIKDGRIGILAPILLVIVSIGIIGLLQGKVHARFARGKRHPVASAGLSAIGAGVLSLIFLLIAWFLLPGQMTVKDDTVGDIKGYSKIKDKLDSLGAKDIVMSHGPKIGFWLTLVGAVLVIVAGVFLFLDGKKKQNAVG